MCFKQMASFTQNAGTLKLVDKITYLSSIITSTESEVNKQLVKVETDIDTLSIIWKSDLFDKIKKGIK